MVFRTTFSKSKSGAVLVDLLVGVSVSSLILIVLVTATFYSGRSFAAMRNYTDLETESRVALDLITQDIRSSRGLSSYSTTEVSVIDQGADPITFSYDQNSRTLTRVKDGASKVLLTGCDLVKWDIFQRTPVPTNGTVYPASTTGTAKLLQVTWVCSRDIMGKKLNTETVRSAKITIRGK